MQSSVRNVFIRGSTVRYVHLNSGSVDAALLEDATRRGEHDNSRHIGGNEPLLTNGIYRSSECCSKGQAGTGLIWPTQSH